MNSEQIKDRVILIVLCVFAFLWLLPMLWILIMSFKPNDILQQTTLSFVPYPFTIEHYLSLIRTSNTLYWLKNSFIVAIMMTLITLILSTTAGYAFARVPFYGRNVLFILVLASFAIPEQAVFLPLHSIFNDWGIHNTNMALILPHLAIPFGVFLMTQFFKGVPQDIEEAARIDGASYLRIFFYIMLPLSKPALTALSIFTFLYAWNDYLWPLVSATKTASYTITTGLASMQSNFAQTESLGFLMASAVFASLPVIIIYVIFQRHIIQGVALSSGK